MQTVFCFLELANDLFHMRQCQVSSLWLKIVNDRFAAFIAFLNQSVLLKVAFPTNTPFWSNPILPLEVMPFHQWIYALLGATCILVGMLIFYIVHYPLPKTEMGTQLPAFWCFGMVSDR